MPGMTRQRVPGFHDYHSNLMECIDWCLDEQKRQQSVYQSMREKLSRTDLGYKADVMRIDLSCLARDQMTINGQLERAVSDDEKVRPIYMLIRLLIRKGHILSELETLLYS